MPEENNIAGQTQEPVQEKTFTQKEVDDIVKQRLERAKKDMPTKEELANFKEWQISQKNVEEKHSEELIKANKEKSDALDRALNAEAKLTAISKGVKSDYVDDVIALAKIKVSDTVTLDQAIDSIIVKYPAFKGVSSTTGVSTANNTRSVSGVEAEFLKRNPDLKI